MHPLGGLGLLIHEIGKALGGGIGQPLVNRHTIAGRFGNLLPVFIQEQLIGEVVRLTPAQRTTDRVIDLLVGGVLLAIHLKIHAQRRPAGAKIRLPLQLHIAAGHRHGPFLAVLIVKGDGVGFCTDLFHRHVKNTAGFRVQRQENRIGRGALFTLGFQHDRHDGIIIVHRAFQHLVKLAGFVEFLGGVEFILKAKGIQEAAQHGVVMRAKAVVGAKRIRHRRQRHLQIGLKRLRIGHIGGHFAQPVQIVGETDQLGWDVADRLKGHFDHRGAGHLTKGADMRQAGGAIAGFKQNIALLWRTLGIAFEKLAGFFKRPGFGFEGCCAQVRHGPSPVQDRVSAKDCQAPHCT